MKNYLLLALCAIGLTTSVQAQSFAGLDKSPLDITYARQGRSAQPDARIVYSRPHLKGRDLSQLAPSGKIWRTGANETTEITFYTSMKIGDKTVAPGTYSLFSIPGEDSWTIILNEQIHTWGAYTYDKNKDLVRTTAKVYNSNNDIEAFSISFEPTENGYTLFMGWGKKIASILLEKS
tara:strand:+ start:1187 stop:1720 length:534 start_codon:yes stop_codon:yes gene_type:complete